MKHVAFFALALFIVPSLSAQECKPSDTIAECWGKFNPLPTAAATEAAATADAENTEDTTAAAPTGITNVASPSESSLKDFLSLLAASMESATSSEEGQAFTFDWNPPIGFAKAVGVKLQASFAETKLSDEVTKKLADADTIEELNDSLEFGDDTTFSGLMQPRNMYFGRSIDAHREWFRRLRDAVRPNTAMENDAFQLAQDALGIVSARPRFDQLVDANNQPLSADDVTTRINLIVAEARRVQARRTASAPFFEAFATLLNNQPQFYGAVIYHARKNVIGPNEWSAKFTYEFAGNNLNAFKGAHPRCADETEIALTCAQELQSFADAIRPGIERLAVSLEYHKVNRRWISDPDAGLDLGFPRTRSFVGSVAFGTNMGSMLPFGTAASGAGGARLDFTAKYELPEDDQSEEKGFVGTLTYTQKISDTFSLPLSFVYSDHESDLLNVDKRFSARFGLMYKLPDLKGLGFTR